MTSDAGSEDDVEQSEVALAPGRAPSTSWLPGGVLREVISAAARGLDDLAAAEVPVSLRRVRNFAPARRESAGASALAAALDADPAFRQRVAARWRVAHPDLVPDVEAAAETAPEGVRGRQWGAGLFLLRPAGWEQALQALRAADAQERERRESRAAAGRREAEIARLGADLQKVREALVQAREDLQEVTAERDQLRKEIRKERSAADRARAQARRAEEELAQARALAEQALSRAAQADSSREERRRAQALDDEARRRRSQRLAALDEVRARLLLDTVVEAAAGLRRELALAPVAERPADLVVDAGPPEEVRSRAAVAVDDPSLLERWLALPQVHLVVDGYNVTKTAYPQRSLVEQRRWLVDALAAVAVRTSAEVTCCFDGAAAQQEPGQLSRGVRVLFSGAAEEADELVRRLVRGEPRGRPLVVVSSDAEVVRGVAAHGARCAAASALVRFLAR